MVHEIWQLKDHTYQNWPFKHPQTEWTSWENRKTALVLKRSKKGKYTALIRRADTSWCKIAISGWEMTKDSLSERDLSLRPQLIHVYEMVSVKCEGRLISTPRWPSLLLNAASFLYKKHPKFPWASSQCYLQLITFIYKNADLPSVNTGWLPAWPM